MSAESQLDRIEKMLRELVKESRERRVAAERESYNETMMESSGMSTEDHVRCEADYKKRCQDIMEGNV